MQKKQSMHTQCLMSNTSRKLDIELYEYFHKTLPQRCLQTQQSSQSRQTMIKKVVYTVGVCWQV